MQKLWKHQENAVKAAADRDYFALFFDVGTGKTRACIEILLEKYSGQNFGLFPTLIFCPPVVISNWQAEIVRYSDIKKSAVILLTGSGKERVKKFSESPKSSIFVTNYEALLMPELFQAMQNTLMNAHGPTAVVADELHKIKTHDSARSKRLHDLGRIATYRFGLTGTPVLNSLEDLFSEFLFLDRGERFGKNYWGFRAKFFHDKNAGMPSHVHFPNWQPRPETKTLMLELIAGCTMSAKKQDCLDLPPLVKRIVHIELGKEQGRLYAEMRDDLVASLTKGSLEKVSIAESALTRALRLQQIASGHMKLAGQNGEEGKTVIIKDNPRRDALKQLLEDIAPNEKTIVWSVFKDNYRDIREVCESLKLKYVELHGEIKDKDASVKAFETDEEIRVLIGHPGSGGIGVNLIASSCSINYTRGFSLEHAIQSEGRNYRGGSERHEKVTQIDIVAKDTIDEIVAEALANKQELSEAVLRRNLRAL